MKTILEYSWQFSYYSFFHTSTQNVQLKLNTSGPFLLSQSIPSSSGLLQRTGLQLPWQIYREASECYSKILELGEVSSAVALFYSDGEKVHNISKSAPDTKYDTVPRYTATLC